MARALWYTSVYNVDELDGHGQIRLLLQRGLAASMLGKKAEGNRIARSVYELILQENLDDLEVHYEYNKLIRLLFNMDLPFSYSLQENLEDLEVHYEYNKLIRLLLNID